MQSIEIQRQFENFFYNVAWLRKSHDLSLQQMGKRIGISPERLS